MEERQGDACGICESCLDITVPGRVHPDVIEFDAASNGGKDEIRAIAERAIIMPLRGQKKIYIIDEAHGLSGPGGQAFLKLLEEPPAHVIFMLATTDPEKMLATNRGRCTEYELLTPTNDEMATNLLRVAGAEGWPLSEVAALAIVESSDPALGVRATLMSLEKLSAALDDGEALSPDDVTTILHSTSRPSIGSLIAAIESGEATAAFEALGLAKETSTDFAIFDALILWARIKLLDSGPSSFEVARYRLAQLVERPRTVGHLEIAVANLTNPQGPTALAALVESASNLASALKAAPVAPLASTEAAASPTTPKTLTDPEEFIDALSITTPRAAALLRSCELTLTGTTLRIAAPEAVRTSLKEMSAPMKEVAATFGIKLTLATTTGRP
jgi:DNA polymerase III subunit gamma/tau